MHIKELTEVNARLQKDLVCSYRHEQVVKEEPQETGELRTIAELNESLESMKIALQ